MEKQGGQRQALIRLGMLGPSLNGPDRYPFMILDNLLGLASGRISTEIRAKRGLAYTAGSGLATFSDTGAWMAGAGTDPQNIDQVIILLLGEMKKVREEPLTKEELEGAIGNFSGRQILSDESNAATAQKLARREVLELMESDESTLERLKQIAPEDVIRVAQKYFDSERYVIVVVKP
ncbi:MAG: insulinase family protein [Candidatus Tectomicrobia bacterium]|nr:insulinase family protein [Candidatus Tectomicrobia bacterium]